MVGRCYLLAGAPVVVLARWRPGAVCPRNVLLLMPDGSRMVRPFRGLRRLNVRRPSLPAHKEKEQSGC